MTAQAHAHDTLTTVRPAALRVPPARAGITRAVAGLPPGEQPRVVVRELPAAAFAPEPQR